MPQSKSGMQAEIAAQIPDQHTGGVTPAVLRGVLSDLATSYQQFPSVNQQTGTSYTVVASDYGAFVSFNNASAVAVTLPSGASLNPFSFFASNLGAGTVTVTPATGTINNTTAITIAQNQGAYIVSDTANWNAILFSINAGGVASVGGQSGTIGIDSTLHYTGSNLGFNLATANTWTGVHTFKLSAGPTAHNIIMDTPGAGQVASCNINSNGIPTWQFGKDIINTEQFYIYDFTRNNYVFEVAGGGSMALMPTGGNVGIGTNAPAGMLDVKGTALFGGGTPWVDVTSVRWGADPTGATDSTTAIQNACNFAATLGISGVQGGVVFFPPGVYKVTSTITVPAFVRLLGASEQSCIITSNNADITVLTFSTSSQQGTAVEHLQIIGGGIINGTFPSSPTIIVPASDDVWFKHCEIYQGNGGVLINGQDIHFEGCRIRLTYGVHAVYCVGTVGLHQAQFWAHYTTFDSIFPTGIAAFPTTISNWAAATPYTAGTIVKVPGVAPGALSVYVQCLTSGTSGGSFPAIDTTIAGGMVDGGAKWLFCSIAGTTAIRLDSGASECYVSQCDMTCTIYDFALVIQNNTPSFGSPQNNFFHHVDFGACFTTCAVVNAGNSLTITECEIGGGFLTAGAGINVTGGSNTTITSCTSTNAGSNASWEIVAIQGGATNTIVGYNTFKSVSPVATAVAIAASQDYFIVVNNFLGGNSISNGSSGATHASVTNNF